MPTGADRLSRGALVRLSVFAAPSLEVTSFHESTPSGPAPPSEKGLKGGRAFRAHTVRSAMVGDIRDARTAGTRPATAPMRIAEAIPPVHASAGMTTAQPFEAA